MSEIKFVTNGYKIPLVLANRDKALEVVKQIVDEIIRERSDYKHFVSWRTESLEVVQNDDRYGHTIVEWKFYVRDSG